MSINCYEFGRKLVESNDLDPVYVVLHRAALDDLAMERWLLAYWCFYHVGTACWITGDTCEEYANDVAYWNRMEQAAGSKEWPRGGERRHYRGQQALDSVAWLKQRGLRNLWDPLRSVDMCPLSYITDYVRTWRRFGPWISFKVADMLERLDIIRVLFRPEDVFSMFDAPMEGARILWQAEGEPHRGAGDSVGAWALQRILEELGDLRAPPRYEREINIQEVETILCKHKSHLNGHYPLGHDIKEVRHGLLQFARCKLAQRLYAAGRDEKLW